MSSGEKARTVLIQVHMWVQTSESLFSSYEVLEFLLRYPLETADSCMSKKCQFSIWKQAWALHFTVSSYDVCIFIHVLGDKKKKLFFFSKPNLGTVYDSSAYVTLILILSTYIPKENCISYELHSSCWSFWSPSLLPGLATQDFQECQTLLTVTLMYPNYWGNLFYKLALDIRSRRETFAQLLSFQNQKGSVFSQGDPNILVSPEAIVLIQVILIMNLNLQWENGEIQKVIKSRNVRLWGNCTRDTHFYDLDL